MTQDVVRVVRVSGRTDGMDAVASALDKVTAGYSRLDQVSEASGRGALSQARAYDAFQRSLDPASKSISQIERNLRSVTSMFETGRIGLQQYTRDLGVLERQLDAIGTTAQRQQRATAAVVDRYLPQTQARDARRQAEEDARQDAIATARFQQERAEFGRSFRERVGVERSPATQSGASASALAEQAKRETDEYEMIERARVARQEQIAQRAAEGQAYDERISAARAKQTGQAFAQSTNDRLGIGQSAQQGGATISALQEQEEEFARLSKASGEYLERIQPLEQAQGRFARSLADIDAMKAHGIITDSQRLKMIDAERTKLENITRDYKGMRGLTGSQVTNLGYQANDIISGLAMGQSPMTILTQQGGQVYQALADTPGGAAAGAKALGAKLLDLITPARLAGAGIVAGATLAYLAYDRFQESLKATERSLNGLGRGSKATVGQIDQIAQATAAAGGMSISSAREVGSAFASTGRIGTDMYGGLIKVARDYAFTTGQETGDAVKELAQAFADPAKGAEMLRDRIGGLSAAQIELVRSLAESGQQLQAQQALLAAVQGNVAKYADQISFWRNEWEIFLRDGSNALDAVGRAMARLGGTDPLDERLARAKARFEELKAAAARGVPDLLSDITGGASSSLQSAKADYDRLKAESDKRAEEADRVDRTRQGAEISGLVKDTDPDIMRLRKLQVEIGKFDQYAKSASGLDVTSEQSRRAAELRKGVVDSYLSQEEKSRRSDALAIAAAQARTAAEFSLIAAEQKRLELAGSLMTATERQRQIEAARLLVLEQVKRVSEDNLRSANDNLRSAGQLPYQRALTDLSSDAALRMRAARGSDKATADEVAATAARRKAIDIEAVGGPLRDARMGLNEQSASLRVQRDSFLATAEAAGTLAARQDLINQYTRAGVPITDALRTAIDQYAASAGKVAAANENLQRTQANIVGGMDEIRSSSRGIMTGLFSDIRQGKNPLEALQTALGSLQDKLVDRLVSKPITEQLLGFDGKGGGGLFGDGLSKLFGDVSGIKIPNALPAMSTASMTVTAATVTVNGGLGAGSLSGLDPLKVGKVDTSPLSQVSTAASPAGASGRVSVSLGAGKSALPADDQITPASLPSTPTLQPPAVTSAVMPRAIVDPGYTPTQAQLAIPFTRRNPELDTLSSEVAARDAERYGGWSGNAPDKETIDRMGSAMAAKAEDMAKAGQAAAQSLSQVGDAGASAAGSLSKIGEAVGQGLKIPDRLPGSGGAGINFGGAGLFGGSTDFTSGFDGLSFTASALGNIMTSRGPLPLSRYAKGGIATSPQISLFGEGRMNEAYVPLPDGRSIPVSMRVPLQPPANSNGSSRPISVAIVNNGRPAEVESVKEESDGSGGRRLSVVMAEMTANGINSTQGQRALRNNNDLRRRVAQR